MKYIALSAKKVGDPCSKTCFIFSYGLVQTTKCHFNNKLCFRNAYICFSNFKAFKFCNDAYTHIHLIFILWNQIQLGNEATAVRHPVCAQHILTDFPALATFLEPSRSLFHKVAYDEVQCWSESVTPNFWTSVYILWLKVCLWAYVVTYFQSAGWEKSCAA